MAEKVSTLIKLLLSENGKERMARLAQYWSKYGLVFKSSLFTILLVLIDSWATILQIIMSLELVTKIPIQEGRTWKKISMKFIYYWKKERWIHLLLPPKNK